MDPRETFKKDALAILLIFVALPAFLYLVGIGCPIKFITGVSCPGCGMSRAWASVLSLDFAHALVCHPLFALGPVIPLAVLAEPFIGRRASIVILIVIACAFIACWAIRMLVFFGVMPEWFPFTGAIVGVEEPVWVTWLEDALS